MQLRKLPKMAVMLTIFILTVICCIDSTRSVNYFVDSHLLCNNVLNQLKTSWVTYLGKFNNTQQCIDACIQYGQGSDKCDSYTYYIDRSECWSYVNNPIWLPYPMPNADCGRIIYPCQSDIDCSFNGVCNKQTGNCTCDPVGMDINVVIYHYYQQLIQVDIIWLIMDQTQVHGVDPYSIIKRRTYIQCLLQKCMIIVVLICGEEILK